MTRARAWIDVLSNFGPWSGRAAQESRKVSRTAISASIANLATDLTSISSREPYGH